MPGVLITNGSKKPPPHDTEMNCNSLYLYFPHNNNNNIINLSLKSTKYIEKKNKYLKHEFRKSKPSSIFYHILIKIPLPFQIKITFLFIINYFNKTHIDNKN